MAFIEEKKQEKKKKRDIAYNLTIDIESMNQELVTQLKYLRIYFFVRRHKKSSFFFIYTTI